MVTGLLVRSVESMLVSKSTNSSSSGPFFATYFFTDGCIFQKHSVFLMKILKFLSEGEALLNGGAPNLNMNRRTPREKISAYTPLYVSPGCLFSISGAM